MSNHTNVNGVERSSKHFTLIGKSLDVLSVQLFLSNYPFTTPVCITP